MEIVTSLPNAHKNCLLANHIATEDSGNNVISHSQLHLTFLPSVTRFPLLPYFPFDLIALYTYITSNSFL